MAGVLSVRETKMAKGKTVQAARIIRNRLAGRCPVTGGCVTRMTEESFLRVCGRHQELARKKAGNVGWGGPCSAQFCIECQGKHLPQELEIIDMEENMPSKKAEGKCDCCGKTKRVKKVHGYMACSICEHLVRAVKNSPELVLRLWGDAHGAEIGGNEEGLADGIRQALNVPDDVASGELPGMVGDLMLERRQYAAELDGVRKALEADGEDDMVEVAERRMAVLSKMESMFAAEHERREDLERRLAAQPQPAVLDTAGGIDMIPLSRLVADEELRVQIDGLAKLLGERP